MTQHGVAPRTATKSARDISAGRSVESTRTAPRPPEENLQLVGMGGRTTDDTTTRRLKSAWSAPTATYGMI